MPSYSRYSDRKDANYNLKDYNEIIEILERLNIHYIDLGKELFEKIDDPKRLFLEGSFSYYNNEGNFLVSNIIVNKVKEFEKSANK